MSRPRLVVLCAFASLACMKLDENASKGSPIDAGPVLSTPPIELPGGGTTNDPCVRTSAQAMDILRTHCVLCHGGDGPDERMGTSLPFDFVLDVDRLTTTRDPSVADPNDPSQGMLFVAPGDPERSRVYLRIAHDEMPPKAEPNRPSFSEISVLYSWIASCLGPKS